MLTRLRPREPGYKNASKRDQPPPRASTIRLASFHLLSSSRPQAVFRVAHRIALIHAEELGCSWMTPPGPRRNVSIGGGVSPKLVAIPASWRVSAIVAL